MSCRGRPGIAGQVEHRDDRLVDAEETTQKAHTCPLMSAMRPRPFCDGATERVLRSRDDDLDTAALDSLDLVRIRTGVGDDRRDLLERHHRAHRDRAELRAVGDHDDPLGALETAADHIGIAVVELGNSTPRRQAGGADHGGVGVVAAHRLDRGRADAGQLVLADQPAGDDHADVARAEEACHRERRRDHHQVLAGGEQAREVLDGRADAEEHRAHADREVRRALGDQALLLGVVQRAGVGAHLERAHQVRRGAAVGAADEAVALEAAEVAPDGHLGDREVAGQRADLDRLVLGDPLQHLQATFHR